MKSEKHNNKKQKIIDAAIAVLQQIGYEETGVRAICDAANISIGTFYHYFKDKNELLHYVLRNIDIYLTEQVSPNLTNESDAVNLKNFGLGFAKETALSSSLYGGVLSSPQIPLPSEKEELLDERKRPLYDIPRRIILHGQYTGEFSTDYNVEEFVNKLITCLRGCAMDWARRNYSYDIEQYIGSLMDIFCKSLQT